MGDNTSDTNAQESEEPHNDDNCSDAPTRLSAADTVSEVASELRSHLRVVSAHKLEATQLIPDCHVATNERTPYLRGRHIMGLSAPKKAITTLPESMRKRNSAKGSAGALGEEFEGGKGTMSDQIAALDRDHSQRMSDAVQRGLSRIYNKMLMILHECHAELGTKWAEDKSWIDRTRMQTLAFIDIWDILQPMETLLYQARVRRFAHSLVRAGSSLIAVLMIEKYEEPHKELCRFFFMSWFFWKMEYIQEDQSYIRVAAKIIQSTTGANGARLSEKMQRLVRAALDLSHGALPVLVADDKKGYSNHNSPRHRAFFAITYRVLGISGPFSPQVVMTKLLKVPRSNTTGDIPSMLVSGPFEAEGDCMFAMEPSSHVSATKSARCALHCQPCRPIGIIVKEFMSLGSSDDALHGLTVLLRTTTQRNDVKEVMAAIRNLAISGARYGWQEIENKKTKIGHEGSDIGPESCLLDCPTHLGRGCVSLLQGLTTTAMPSEALASVNAEAMALWRNTADDKLVWDMYVPCFSIIYINAVSWVSDLAQVAHMMIPAHFRGAGMYDMSMIKGEFGHHRTRGSWESCARHLIKMDSSSAWRVERLVLAGMHLAESLPRSQVQDNMNDGIREIKRIRRRRTIDDATMRLVEFTGHVPLVALEAQLEDALVASGFSIEDARIIRSGFPASRVAMARAQILKMRAFRTESRSDRPPADGFIEMARHLTSLDYAMFSSHAYAHADW